MQTASSKRRLRLVKPGDAAVHATPAPRPVPAPQRTPRTTEYFRRVEDYARRIRASGDVLDIINILDEALTDTRALGLWPRPPATPARLQKAEREIEALQIELRHLRGLVHVDPLTGALNRSGLDHCYRREAARADRSGAPLGVALLDLDDFKRLNDSHGHQAGDAALVHLAGVIRASLRPSDVVVRFGGEEFLFLLPDSDTAQAAGALERLLADLQQRPLLCGGASIPLAFSAGVTVRRSGEQLDAVIAAADRALYAAKRAGKRCVMAAAADFPHGAA